MRGHARNGKRLDSALRIGFRCEPSVNADFRVLRQQAVQFLTGIARDSDVWFEVETDTLRYLVPVHNAILARAGTAAPGKSGCSSMPLSIGGINVDLLPVGTYVCVKTTSGRFSQVQVTGGPGLSPGVLTLDFITYD